MDMSTGPTAWPHFVLDDGLGQPKLKRRKIDTACELCRVRKTRCDGARPKCDRCKKRKNAGDACTYLDNNRREQVFNELEIRRIESTASNRWDRPAALQKHIELGADVGLQTQDTFSVYSDSPRRQKASRTSFDERSSLSKDAIRTSPTHSLVSPRSQPHNRGRADRRTSSRQPNDNDLYSDEDATGPAENWIVKAGLLGASGSSGIVRSICKAVDGDTSPGSDKSAPGTAPIRKSSRSVPEKHIRRGSTLSAEYVLPSRKVADHLLDLHWKCSHVPWVDRLRLTDWYDGLWTGQEDQQSYEVDEQVYHYILNTIFALAYRSDPTLSTEEQERLSDAFFSRAEKLLTFNLLEINYIGLVQALLLTGQYLQSANLTRKCFQCVGLAILVAQNLELHVPQKLASIKNQHDREMARRAWHGCILMDRITSMTFGRPFRISQEAARRSPLPAAIDDEYLEVGEIDGTQPPDRPSRLCFFLAFCKLHIILGDILATLYHGRGPAGDDDSAESDPASERFDVDKIMAFDHALSSWRENLEDHLQVQPDGTTEPRFRGQAVNLFARFLHIRILLYRTFFSRSLTKLAPCSADRSVAQDPRFTETITGYGLVTCVKAAQQILELISSNIDGDGGSPGVAPPWYHVVSYVYTAATIVIAAHLIPHVVDQLSLSSLTKSTTQSLEILEHYGRSQKPAQRCKTALVVLYSKITSSEAAPKKTPNGSAIPSFPEPNGGVEMVLPSSLVWDVNPLEAFADGEFRWLEDGPFDNDNNFWL